MSSFIKRSDEIASDQAMIDGITKFLMQFPTLPVGSQSMTPAAMIQVFQGRLNTSKAAQVAEAARTTAVKADRDQRAKTAIVVQSLRQIVQGMFNQSPDTLAVFLLKPRKAVKTSVEVKQIAVAKNAATRKARHTVGPKAKLEITGETAAATSGAPLPATPTSQKA